MSRRTARRCGTGLAMLLALGLWAELAAGGAAFDPRAAWSHLERLVAFGPRPSGSAALASARAYVVAELRRIGVSVREQAFTGQTPDGPIRMVNVIAELPGRRREVILLGGHFDTKYFPSFRFVGANDGGSSAALLLELARSLSQKSREFTVWIVFFDGEEARGEWSATDGIYGSRHMVAELRRTGQLDRVRAVVVVDMIGDRALNIRREAASTPWLTDLIWASARRLAYQAHFLDATLAVEDDHTPFLRAGIPSTLVIDFDYAPYWHTPEDTLDKLSPRSLQIIGEVLLDALPVLENWLAAADGVESRPRVRARRRPLAESDPARRLGGQSGGADRALAPDPRHVGECARRKRAMVVGGSPSFAGTREAGRGTRATSGGAGRGEAPLRVF